MIADILTHAIQSIDLLLYDPLWRDQYQGARRAKLLYLRLALEALREEVEAAVAISEQAPREG